MSDSPVQKLLSLQEKARQDADFRRLYQEYEVRDRQLRHALNTMDVSQQDAVTDYIGLLIEMHTKLLQIACK